MEGQSSHPETKTPISRFGNGTKHTAEEWQDALDRAHDEVKQLISIIWNQVELLLPTAMTTLAAGFPGVPVAVESADAVDAIFEFFKDQEEEVRGLKAATRARCAELVETVGHWKNLAGRMKTIAETHARRLDRTKRRTGSGSQMAGVDREILYTRDPQGPKPTPPDRYPATRRDLWEEGQFFVELLIEADRRRAAFAGSIEKIRERLASLRTAYPAHAEWFEGTAAILQRVPNLETFFVPYANTGRFSQWGSLLDGMPGREDWLEDD